MGDRPKRKVIALNSQEEAALVKKTREINRMLFDLEAKMITESELVHIILEQTIGYVHLEGGKIKVR